MVTHPVKLDPSLLHSGSSGFSGSLTLALSFRILYQSSTQFLGQKLPFGGGPSGSSKKIPVLFCPLGSRVLTNLDPGISSSASSTGIIEALQLMFLLRASPVRLLVGSHPGTCRTFPGLTSSLFRIVIVVLISYL